MSEHKQAGVAASVNSGMVVHGGARPGRVRLPAKMLSVAVVIFVVVACGVGLVVWRHAKSPSGTNANMAAKTPPAGITQEQKAQFYADNGQYEQAEQSWQDQLAGASTASEKVAVYYQQAAVAIRYKQYGDAQKYAGNIQKIAPNAPDSYVVLAQLAKAQDDIPKAKQYWQQAINHVDISTSAGLMIRSDYIHQMDALK